MLKFLTWLLAGILLVAVLLVSFAFGLVATEAGTRFVFARAQPYLPEAISVGSVGGTLLSELRIEDFRWNDASLTVEVDSLRGKLAPRALLRRRIEVSTVRVRGVRVVVIAAEQPADAAAVEPSSAAFSLDLPVDIVVDDLRADDLRITIGDLERRLDSLTTTIELIGSDLSIRTLAVDADWAGLGLDGELRLAPPYEADLRADWRYRLSDTQTYSGNGWLSGQWDGYELDHELRSPYLVETHGSIRWQQEPIFDLVNSWSDIALELPDGRKLSSPRGELAIDGALSAYRYSLDAAADVEPVGAAAILASGSGSLESLRIASAVVSSPDRRIGIEGRVDIAPGGADWDAMFDIDNFDPALVREDLEGSISVAGQSSGSLAEWRRPALEAAIDELDGRLFGQEIGGNGRIRIDGPAVTFEKLALRSGENALQLDGTIDEVLNIEAIVDAKDLAAVWPGLGGSAAGKIGLRGKLDAPLVSGSLNGEKLAFREIFVESIRLTGTGRQTELHGVEINASGLRYGATMIDSVAAKASGTLAAHRLELRAAQMDRAIGLSLAGGYEAERWHGALEAATLSLGESGRWTLDAPAAIHMTRDELRVSRLCVAGGGGENVCAEFLANIASGSWQLQAEVDSVPVAALLMQAYPQLDATGSASGEISLSFSDGRYDGEFSAALADTELSLREDVEGTADPFEETVPLGLSIAGTVRSNRVELTGDMKVGGNGTGDIRFALADFTRADSPVSSEFDFELDDLGFLSLFIVAAEIRGGTLNGQLTLDGTRNAPIADGTLTVDGATVLVSASGAELTEVRLRVVPTGPGRIGFEGSAVSNGGRLTITGVTNIEPKNGFPTELEVAGESVRMIRLPDWSVVASPDLEIEATTSRAKLRGRIVIPEASIALGKIPDTAESPSPDTVVHRAGQVEAEAAFGYDLDISVVIKDKVRLQGFGLETGLRGKLQLTGTENKPFRGIGELNLVDGQFEAYGQALVIERGRLNFTGSLENPALDIRATRRIDTVTVGISMAGTVEQPRSTIFSDPPMSEASALSYLITGRPLQSAQAAEGNMLANAAIGLGLSQAGNITAEISASLGLDELSIEGGSTDGRVLAGKRISEKLYLQYAFGIFDQLGSLLLRYRLSDRLLFETESGEEQSLDLVYSVGRD